MEEVNRMTLCWKTLKIILNDDFWNFVILSYGYRWLADVNILNQYFVPGNIIEICPGIERLKYSSSIWELSDNLKRKVKEYVIYDINMWDKWI